MRTLHLAISFGFFRLSSSWNGWQLPISSFQKYINIRITSVSLAETVTESPSWQWFNAAHCIGIISRVKDSTAISLKLFADQTNQSRFVCIIWKKRILTFCYLYIWLYLDFRTYAWFHRSSEVFMVFRWWIISVSVENNRGFPIIFLDEVSEVIDNNLKGWTDFPNHLRRESAPLHDRLIKITI